MIPDVARAVGNRFDGDFPQTIIQATRRFGDWGGIGQPGLDGRMAGVFDFEVRNPLPWPALPLGLSPFDTQSQPVRVAREAAGREIAEITIRVGLELASPQFLDEFNSALPVKDESKLAVKRGFHQRVACLRGRTCRG